MVLLAKATAFAALLFSDLAHTHHTGPGAGPGTCKNPYVRKEWRRLKNKERENYIAAVKCMQSQPGTAPVAAVQSRYDDFIATHQAQTETVHFTGIFYPYHRLLLNEYEKALWACGWDDKLGQPYWDWTLDTGSLDEFLGSPVFDSVTGFGGNGAYIPGNLSSPQLPGFVSSFLSSINHWGSAVFPFLWLATR